MNKGLKLVLVAFALLLVLPAASIAQQYGKQSGTVTDVDGKPLAGVVVKTGKEQVKTGENGKFTFQQLRAGGNMFMFAFPGYQPKQVMKQINGGLNNRPIKIQLVKSELTPAQKAGALGQAGLELFHAQKVGQALVKFQAALEYNPGDVNLHFYAGICLSQTGKYADALKHLLPVLEKSPNHPQLNMVVADDYFYQEKFKESLPYYEKLITLNIADASSYLNMGIAYEREGNNVKAIESFTKVTALDAKNADAFMRLGLLHANVENHDGAAAALDQYITLKPNAPEVAKLKGVLAEALVNVAITKYEADDIAGARKAWQRIIEIAPESTQAENAKAGLAETEGK